MFKLKSITITGSFFAGILFSACNPPNTRDFFHLNPPGDTGPSLISLSPSTGPTSGGTSLTLTGTNFDTTDTVTVGGQPCTDVSFVSATQLTCFTPSGNVGGANVTVQNGAGQASTLANGFTYESTDPPPQISGVTPNAGPTTGGTTITLTGTNFMLDATATVGGIACTNPTVISSTSFTCVTPPNSAGSYNVTLSNTDGQTATQLSAFNYEPSPAITLISPTAGPAAGGSYVTITGTGFFSGATVTIGGSVCSNPAIGTTMIICTTPPGSIGAADVVVTNTDGQSTTDAGGYSYQGPPTVTAVAPGGGPTSGGTAITVTGTGFLSNATVSLGGAPCASVSVVSVTQITCTTPPRSSGTVNVVVTNYDGQNGTKLNAFVYEAAPVPLTVSPIAGALGGGTLITINGTGFVSGATVAINNATCTSATVTSATQMTCLTPSNAAGTYNIVVTNPDSQNGTLLNGYTYQAAPAITSLSPTAGPLAGGTFVTITGTGFLANATVSIGGMACNLPIVVSSTEITCTTQSESAGTKNVVVTNWDTQTGTKLNGYTFEVAPTVTAINPTAGALGGGTVVTLTGTEFLPGITVTVGGVSCTGVNVLSQTQLTCSTSAHAPGTVGIVVTNLDTQTGSLSNAYTYEAAPTIISLLPTAGALAGGTTITITGTGYFTGATVTVGSTACTTPTVVSSTEMTCVTPMHTAGSYNVTVTNPDTQFATLTNGYTYEPAPTVTSIALPEGSVTGGVSVTITGTGFITGATVAIGGVSCTGVTVVSSTSLTCTTPGGTAGSANVTVTNLDTQSGTLTAGYTYEGPPSLTSINPIAGALNGGTLITLTGTNFLSGATVTVGGTSCLTPTVVSSTQMTCTTQAHAAGAVNVVVTNVDTQSSTLSGGYTYEPAPTVTSISPSKGALAGGTPVTITGTGFLLNANVTIGGAACTSVVVNSSTQIACNTPSQVAGTYTVTVTNFDSQPGSLVNGYTYEPAPTITLVTASSGPAIGGTSVTLTGSGFLSGATVTIGGVVCTSPNVISLTSMTCTTGVGAPGLANVIVTNLDLQSGTGTGLYTYIPAPTVTSVTPNSGALAGGTTVLIAGTGFLTGPTISFGGSACTSVSFISSTQISCVTTSHAAGAVSVSVTNTDTQSGSLSSAYTYNGAPTVSTVNPTAGAVVGGTNLTITGAGFITGATVSIGGANCTSVIVASANSLTCTTTAKSAGTYSITVTNPDTQAGSLNNSYTYEAGPSVTSINPIAGALGGGTSVTIMGAAFMTGATVTIGTSPCSITLATSSEIICTTSVGTTGTKNVVVTNPDTQTGTLTNGYTYEPAPFINFATPSAGALAGGTTVTLTGSGFLTGATVMFGSNACGSVNVVSSTSLTCVTVANSAGSVNILVTNTDTQFGTLTNGYTYQPAPTLTAINPTAGALAGGTLLTLTGTGFLAGATVWLASTVCTNLNVISPTSATCITPANPAGHYNVQYINSDNQMGSLSAAYAYEAAPMVTSITPNAGALAGGTPITIVGSGFLANATVTIGGTSCGSIVITPTQITCNTPSSSAGPADVVITNTDTQQVTVTGGYTYQPAPTLTSVTPVAGALGGGTTISAVGTGFVSGASVSFGGTLCESVAVTSSTALTCVTGAHTAGPVDVLVTNADTQASNTLPAAYLYQAGPSITSIAPTAGALAGNTIVTLSGANFLSGATITVGTLPCTASAYVNSSTMTCTTPAQAAGTYDVTVTNPDNQLFDLTASYTYEPAPTVSAISPTSGFLYGNYNLTITGTGFLTGAAVTLGTAVCNNITVVSSTQITCTAPTVMAAGIFNVTVTNSDTQFGSLTNGFTYNIDGFTQMNLVAGSMGNSNSNATGTSARMSDNLFAITTDGTNLYVADSGYCVIRKVVISSTVATTLAGTPGNCVAPGSITDNTGASASFSAPTSIFYVGGTLYVGDAYTIRTVDPNLGTVVTVAGAAGTGGTTDNPGTSARFGAAIYGLTSDGTYLYIADTNNHTIRRMALSNNDVSTFAGTAGTPGNTNATGTSATFNFPHGISTDNTYIYVADASNNLIRDITISNQQVSTLAGSGTAAEQDGTGTGASFNAPYSVFVKSGGATLYVVDFAGGVVRSIKTSTGVVTTITSQNQETRNDIGTAAYFASPMAVTGDSTYIYVTDRALASVRKINMTSLLSATVIGQINQFGYSNGSGTAVQFFGLYAPTLVTATPMLYAPDQGNCQIRSIDPVAGAVQLYAGNAAGTCSTSVGHGSGSDAYFNNPQSITNDGINLYVGDGRTIREIALDSSYVSVLTGQLGSSGAADGSSSTALFGGSTYGIATDGTNLYVTDYANHAIRQVVIASGYTSTLAGDLGVSGTGDGTGTGAYFHNPMGITISTDNSTLYVADTGNCSIRQIVISTQVVSTLAGQSGTCGYVDNNTGTSAQFNSPTTLTTDGTNLYAYDSVTNVIREIVIQSTAVSSFLVGQVGGNPYWADIDGAIGSADIESPNGLYWSPYGFFVTNPYNIRRIH